MNLNESKYSSYSIVREMLQAAIDKASRVLGRDIPIFVQVTVETTGTLLVGPDIAAAATVIQSLDVPQFSPTPEVVPSEAVPASPTPVARLAMARS